MNVCNIAPKVSSIKGLKSNSASPTDTWILSLNEDLTTPMKTKIRNLFMKLYISPRSLYAYKHIKGIDDRILNLTALNYEIQVYYLVRNLVLGKVSPCFVIILTNGDNCSFKNIMDILSIQSIPEKNFVRNISYTISGENNRPSINDNKYKFVDNATEAIIKSSAYNIIVTEPISADNLFDWMDSRKYNQKDLWKILFQVSVATYSLFLANINHNDLHAGNVFIVDLGKEEMYYYRVNGTDYTLKTRYLAKLYDFDRAYFKGVKNDLLEGWSCDEYSQCNNLVENRDFIKLMCYVYNDLSVLKDKILALIAPNIKSREILDNTYNVKRCFLQTEDRGKLISLPTRVYKEFYTMTEIINTLFSYINETFSPMEIKSQLKVENIYCCMPEFFNSNGILNETKNRNEIKTIVEAVLAPPRRKEKSPSPRRKVKSPSPMSIESAYIKSSKSAMDVETPYKMPIRRKSPSPVKRIRYISPRRKSPVKERSKRRKSLSRSRYRRKSPSPVKRVSIKPRRQRIRTPKSKPISEKGCSIM